jgi:acyl carrier protein
MVSTEPLYEIAMRSGAGATWRTRGRVLTQEGFARYLWEGSECGFAVTAAGDRTVVGFVGLYGVDPPSQVGSMSAFFDPRHPRAAVLAGDAIQHFCRYVFEVIGLRKLTVEMPRPFSEALRRVAASQDCVTHEGTLVAQTRMGATLRDLDLFAVWADPFIERFGADAVRRGAASGVASAAGESEAFALVVASVHEVLGTDGPAPSAIDGGHQLVVELGLDSLALFELFDTVEERAGVVIDLTDAGATVSVRDVVSAVESAWRRAGG